MRSRLLLALTLALLCPTRAHAQGSHYEFWVSGAEETKHETGAARYGHLAGVGPTVTLGPLSLVLPSALSAGHQRLAPGTGTLYTEPGTGRHFTVDSGAVDWRDSDRGMIGAYHLTLSPFPPEVAGTEGRMVKGIVTLAPLIPPRYEPRTGADTGSDRRTKGRRTTAPRPSSTDLTVEMTSGGACVMTYQGIIERGHTSAPVENPFLGTTDLTCHASYGARAVVAIARRLGDDAPYDVVEGSPERPESGTASVVYHRTPTARPVVGVSGTATVTSIEAGLAVTVRAVSRRLPRPDTTP